MARVLHVASDTGIGCWNPGLKCTPFVGGFIHNLLEESAAAALQRRSASYSAKPPNADRRTESVRSLERQSTKASDSTLANLLKVWWSRSQAVNGAAEDGGKSESGKYQATVEARQGRGDCEERHPPPGEEFGVGEPPVPEPASSTP